MDAGLILDGFSHMSELVLAVGRAMCLKQVSPCFFKMEAGPKIARKRASTFQLSVCITFPNVSLAK